MAGFIEWTDNLILGLQEVDDQHLGIITILNRLAKVAQLKMGAAYYSASSPSTINAPWCPLDSDQGDAIGTDTYIHQLLDELICQTHGHFQCEEALMEAHHYPDLAEHKREHTMLIAELKLFVRDIKKGVESLNQKTLGELKRWLIVHIRRSDKAFSDYVHSAGTQYILPFHLQAHY
jgi:hemerythrin